MTQPLVSILIPVYNREVLVCRAIDSALAQTYENIEIIVCDNASTDHTWEVLREYEQKDKRIRIFRNESNVGPVGNWERCLENATGEYAKFLWSDDEIQPTFVEILIKPLIENAQVGFSFSDITIRSEYGDTNYVYAIGGEGLYKGKYFIKEAFKNQSNMPVSPGCALFRTADFREYLLRQIPNNKGLDFSRYGAGNDLLLFMQVAYKYPYFYFTPQDLSIFYAAKDSFTMNHNLEKYYRTARYYFLKGKHDIWYLYLYNAVQGKLDKWKLIVRDGYSMSKRGCKKLFRKLYRR